VEARGEVKRKRMTQHPPTIGVVGGIGSGKSALSAAFEDLGCVVAYSDVLAHEALRHPAIVKELVHWWGTEILDADGHIMRRALADIVFNDPDQRERLERLTHPWIEQRRKAMFAAAPPDTRAFVIDAPLLLEVGLDRECDAIVFVDTQRPQRILRVREQRGWDERDLLRRESAQIPLDAKRQRADYVVSNTGDLQALTDEARRVLDTILATRQTRS
jgi:dephospho-CoA kinase